MAEGSWFHRKDKEPNFGIRFGTQLVPLDRIKLDVELQSRVSLNKEKILEYAEARKAKVELPPPDLFRDGTKIGTKDDWFYIGDGWHRVLAEQSLPGATHIIARVQEGTREDALVFACGANSGHGIQRTSEDKRKAISILLMIPEWRVRGDRHIMRQCKLTNHHLVAEVRAELKASGKIPLDEEDRVVKRGNQTYKQKAKKEQKEEETLFDDNKSEVPGDPPKSELEESVERVLANAGPLHPKTLMPQTTPEKPGVAEDSATPKKNNGSWQHYNSPAWLVAAGRQVAPGGIIGLDPCGNPTSLVAAEHEFTEHSDGLSKAWYELVKWKLIYINPPYNNIQPWATKTIEEAKLGANELLVVPNWSDRVWWQELAEACQVRCELKGRVAFLKEGKPDQNPQDPTVVFCFGGGIRDAFIEVFQKFGRISFDHKLPPKEEPLVDTRQVGLPFQATPEEEVISVPIGAIIEQSLQVGVKAGLIELTPKEEVVGELTIQLKEPSKEEPDTTLLSAPPEEPSMGEPGTWLTRSLAQLEQTTTREDFDTLYLQLLGTAVTDEEKNTFRAAMPALREKREANQTEMVKREVWLKVGKSLLKNGWKLLPDKATLVLLTPKQLEAWLKDEKISLREPDWFQKGLNQLNACPDYFEAYRIFDGLVDMTVTEEDRDKVQAAWQLARDCKPSWNASKKASKPKAPKPTRKKGRNEEKVSKKRRGR